MNRPDLERLRARYDRHVLPPLFAAYLLSFLDRVNIAFVAGPMGKDLGLGPSAFGFGAGLFFVGYFLLEVPSNLLLARVGARVWLACLTTAWGLMAALGAAAWSPTSFFVARFLLGVAEAGFAPALIVHIMAIYPESWRARAFAQLWSATAIALVIGAPLSAVLLRLDGALGVAGWRWVLIAEAIPAVVLGLALARLLLDRPEKAVWLSEGDRASLIELLGHSKEAVRSSPIASVLGMSRLWVFCAAYLLLGVGFYGATFWLPQLIPFLTVSRPISPTLFCVIVFLGAIPAMFLVSRWSDRSALKLPLACGGSIVASAAFAATAFLASAPVAALVALGLAALALWSVVGIFWQLPAAAFDAESRPVAMAVINSCGSLGGFLGPFAIGILRERFGSFVPALWLMAGALLLASVVLAFSNQMGRSSPRRR